MPTIAERWKVFATLNADSLIWAALVALWIAPALISLAGQSWQTEAGSLAPITLSLGLWTLYRTVMATHAPRSSSAQRVGVVGILALLPVHLFAAAIDMAPLLALSAWAGGCMAFVALNGWNRTRACAFPLMFIGLVVPLPYTLSLPFTFALRAAVADWSTDFARAIGMDAALDGQIIIIGGYEVAVDAACAGVNSTVSLVAIGLLYAYWARRGGWARITAIALASIPIALAANVLRVVALMLLTQTLGPDALATFWHPLAGIISFVAALLLLLSLDGILTGILASRSWKNAGMAT